MKAKREFDHNNRVHHRQEGGAGLSVMSAAILNTLKKMLILLVTGAGIWIAPPAAAETGDFSRWLEDFRTEARAAGISEKLLEKAFEDLEEPLLRVIELDRRQPEAVQTGAEYVAARVTSAKVKSGKRMLARYQTFLEKIERQYAVQPCFLVALWGMETHYGQNTGNFPVIQSLVTLAYDGRRSAYFRRELLQALRILEEGHISLPRMRGSWAGAMGHCQFMPTTFLRHAVDGDDDGRIDLWGSIPDALASSANYLSTEMWRRDQTWGCPVELPAGFDYSSAGLDKRLPLASWRDLGVRLPENQQGAQDASLVLPDGPPGPAYLVYDNFRALMRWNRSVSFAIAVGTLADRIGARQQSNPATASPGQNLLTEKKPAAPP
jgi:membrane-bound lytic murein transglycosylase B